MEHIQVEPASAASPKAPAELQDLAAKPLDQRDKAGVKIWKKGDPRLPDELNAVFRDSALEKNLIY